mmetsp:Transcript_21200/g.44510  ORF Transcript_21200/g.44510 Transcript_21200/m.44510 type:complete len:200 (+) Transcript_21200:326-925(+)
MHQIMKEDTRRTGSLGLDPMQYVRLCRREDAVIVQNGRNIILDKTRGSTKPGWSIGEKSIYRDERSVVLVHLIESVSMRTKVSSARIANESPSEVQPIRLPLAVQLIVVGDQAGVLEVFVDRDLLGYAPLDSFEDSVRHVLIVQGHGGRVAVPHVACGGLVLDSETLSTLQEMCALLFRQEVLDFPCASWYEFFPLHDD